MSSAKIENAFLALREAVDGLEVALDIEDRADSYTLQDRANELGMTAKQLRKAVRSGVYPGADQFSDPEDYQKKEQWIKGLKNLVHRDNIAKADAAAIAIGMDPDIAREANLRQYRRQQAEAMRAAREDG
jgi:hypothetical protein